MSEVFKLENNEVLRVTLDSMQMPTVEYKEISVDDYSRCRKCSGLCHIISRKCVKCDPRDSNPRPSVSALSLQILKPATFMETSHYPLLLLV